MSRRSTHTECPVVADRATKNWHTFEDKRLIKAGRQSRVYWQQRAQLIPLRALLPIPILSPLGLDTGKTARRWVEIATICRLCKKVTVTNGKALNE